MRSIRPLHSRPALRRLVLALALVPAALVLAPDVAQACSCMATPGPVESARRSDVVFSARLISIADAPDSRTPEFPDKVATFAVLATFKGNLDPEIRLITANNSAACGRDYGAAGSEWLIYARQRDNGQLHDNLCSRTMPLASATTDLEELGAAADTLSEPPTQTQPEPPSGDEGAVTEVEPMFFDDRPGGDDEPAGDDGPEPASPGKKGCSVEPAATTPAGGLLGLLGLGLLVGLRRRR